MIPKPKKKKHFWKTAVFMLAIIIGLLGFILLASYFVAPDEAKEKMLQLPEAKAQPAFFGDLIPTHVIDKLSPKKWMLGGTTGKQGNVTQPPFNGSFFFFGPPGNQSGDTYYINTGGGSSSPPIFITTHGANGTVITQPITEIIREKIIEVVIPPLINETISPVFPIANIINITNPALRNTGTGSGSGNAGNNGGSTSTTNANTLMLYSGPGKKYDHGMMFLPTNTCTIHVIGSVDAGYVNFELWKTSDQYSFPTNKSNTTYKECKSTLHCGAKFTFSSQEKMLAYYITPVDSTSELTKVMVSYDCQ